MDRRWARKHCKWRDLRGVTLLREFLVDARNKDRRKGGLGQKELADLLGTGETVIYAWKIGFRRPGTSYREGLLKLAKIPVDAWLTDSERERRAQILGTA